MKKRILKILILLLIIILVIWQGGGFNFLTKSSTALANGDLEIDWGVVEPGPIFVVSNMLPGDTEERSVDVTNNATVARPVGVRGVKTSEIGNFSSVLNVVITEGANTLYGPAGLNQFFTDSAGPDGISLSTLGPGDTTTYTFNVTFNSGAGNEFQGKSVVFDLKIGISVEIPAECQRIQFSGNPIFGTEKRDVINGTNGNDLIFAFEGDDVINSSNGNDCVVGGPGNDVIHNSNGEDVLLGNEGEDRLNGSNGKDWIYGGPGNDTINGSNGDDWIEGGEGNDKIDAGNGNDRVSGGDGDDQIDAGNGNDHVNGEGGNDKMLGKNGNDNLVGGAGLDLSDGGLGTDTCDAETEIKCEL